MKTLVMLAMVFFVFIAESEAGFVFTVDPPDALTRAYLDAESSAGEDRAFPITPSDPRYTETKQAYCETVSDSYDRFSRERAEMDSGYPMQSIRSEESRQDWIIDWVITTALKEQAQQDFYANCR
jgi:hypothetical protein